MDKKTKKIETVKEDRKTMKIKNAIEKEKQARKKDEDERIYAIKKNKDMRLADTKVKDAITCLTAADTIEKNANKKYKNGVSAYSISSDLRLAEDRYGNAGRLFGEALEIYVEYKDDKAKDCKKNFSYCMKKKNEMQKKQTVKVRV